jgi:hypothetical protein
MPIGDIAPLSTASLMKGNPLMIVVDLHIAFAIMDQAHFADIAVGHAVVVLIGR